MLFVYRLLERVEIRRRLIGTIENAERIAIDEVRRRCRQSNHPCIEIVDDLGETYKNRAVGFIENDQVEEARAKFIEGKIHCLLSRNKEALCRVDVMRVNAI